MSVRHSSKGKYTNERRQGTRALTLLRAGLVAIVAFAITGVLAAAPRTQSVLSLIALAIVSAVGRSNLSHKN